MEALYQLDPEMGGELQVAIGLHSFGDHFEPALPDLLEDGRETLAGARLVVGFAEQASV
jgi:hypothetical protein